MNDLAATDAYGTISEPATLRIQRLLPGPIERVWDYLTQSELRRKWLASGDMGMKADAPFELTWRNDELTQPPGERPDGFPAQHGMESRITEIDPPRKLAFTWKGTGDVMFELEPQGSRVLLTLTHERLPERRIQLMIAAGWHMHLDILAARVAGAGDPEPFWDGWARLQKDYDGRLPA